MGPWLPHHWQTGRKTSTKAGNHAPLNTNTLLILAFRSEESILTLNVFDGNLIFIGVCGRGFTIHTTSHRDFEKNTCTFSHREACMVST